MSDNLTNYVDQLAAFAAELRYESLPAEAADRVRLVILDVCGAAIGAMSEPELRALAAWAEREGGGPSAQTLAFGSAGVALELDEGCAASKGHPGVHVVPAALAHAGKRRLPGSALVVAVAAGYEIAARLGAASDLRPGLHPHGTWGACGAAAAVGHLIGLDRRRMAQALRIAACLSLATNYRAVHEGTTVRNLWSGFGGFSGGLAAEMAAAGFTGPLDAPAEVYGGTIGNGFDRDKAVMELGRRWLILDNYFKIYACCRHAHASVDALRSACEGRPIDPSSVEAISVFTYGRAVASTGRPEPPRTPLAAKFSLPYILATWLHRADLGPDSFRPPVLGDPAIMATAGKVTCLEDHKYTRLMPGTRGARVALRLTTGEELAGEALGSRGDPHAPLSRAEVREKFLGLASPVLGGPEAEGLAKAILGLDHASGVPAVFECLNDSMRKAAQ